MKRAIHIGIAIWALALVPTVALAERASKEASGASKEKEASAAAPMDTITPGAPVFPATEKCTTSSPCTNVAGEITRIEESYWIRTPNGREIHLKVTGDSHMKEIPQVGDNIAAQLDSTGGVQALMRMQEPAKAPEAEVPSKTQDDVRHKPGRESR